jgi:hypothetical protein
LNGLEGGRTATAGANAGLRRLLDGVRAAQAARIWPEIADPTTAQRDAMPYEIDCAGVTVHDLGEAFAVELHDRKRRCRDNCTGVFAVEPTRDRRIGRDTGRRFRFSDRTDAAMFRLSWC